MKSLKLLLVLAAIVSISIVVYAWVDARRDEQSLKATIATQNKALDAANADKRQNDSDRQKALAQINSLKRRVKTPSAAVQGLNESLPLPEPITFVPVEETRATPLSGASTGNGNGSDGSRPGSSPISQNPDWRARAKASPPGSSAILPAVDLVPLYQYTQNCRACSVELDSARANALDDQKKIAALTAQRDAAVKTSRGGSVVRRIKQSAIWFAVGAGVGYALSTLDSHGRSPNPLTRENQYYVTRYIELGRYLRRPNGWVRLGGLVGMPLSRMAPRHWTAHGLAALEGLGVEGYRQCP